MGAVNSGGGDGDAAGAKKADGSEGGAQDEKSKEKAIRSLEKRREEHVKKLEEYRKNPDAFDNKGHLKNAPSPEVRQRIIDGRTRHLEGEIRNFDNMIAKLRG